jgi:hypothetical protein
MAAITPHAALKMTASGRGVRRNARARDVGFKLCSKRSVAGSPIRPVPTIASA